MKTICQIRGYHNVAFDKFGSIKGVGRTVPGDCYCIDCRELVAAWFNRGRPVPVKSAKPVIDPPPTANPNPCPAGYRALARV